ncbi:MAG: hypothetical protein OK457_05865, partial [Thaumarchaeota archaeon]|nr:hypothetical protein [Nitrososphaerota archaeon]
MLSWKFSYLPYFGFKSMEEALQAISKLGYEGVELPSLIPYRSALELQTFVNQARALNLEVSEVGFSQDFVDLEDDRRREKVRATREKI